MHLRYHKLEHSAEFYDFKLNKMSEKWLMAFKDIKCSDVDDVNCRESYKKAVWRG